MEMFAFNVQAINLSMPLDNAKTVLLIIVNNVQHLDKLALLVLEDIFQ